MKRFALLSCALLLGLTLSAQENLKKVYDESIDPEEQIDKAVSRAASSGKYVMCQLGGNWCRWCLRFADFISKDEEISRLVADNYVYIHANYNPRVGPDAAGAEKIRRMMKRLGNPDRFGYPVLIVLDGKGNVVHIQDSGYLEKDSGYDREKVLRFFINWTPAAVRGE